MLDAERMLADDLDFPLRDDKHTSDFRLLALRFGPSKGRIDTDFQPISYPLIPSLPLSLSPSRPSPSPISMALAADVNANLIRSLKIVQSLGEAVPHGGILKAVAGVGIMILETAEARSYLSSLSRRAAEHIAVLKRLDEDEELSDDLVERLERYHSVLKEILPKVERLGTESRWKRTLKASSVQDEMKDCLNRLNEAYQMYIFESSIATDTKLTTIERGVTALSLRLEAQMTMGSGETNEIPMRQIEFGEEISRVERTMHIFKVEHGQMRDFTGKRRAVILRRFEVKPEVEDKDRGLEEFKKEVELRGDFLNRHVARMLGIASSDTGRTKMIVVEAGTVTAYDYLQKFSGLQYLLEHTRIMSEFVAGYRFLREHRGSWRGGYQDILLSAKDKRLCMGGLGRMDSRWEDSGWRMDEAFFRLKNGNDSFAGGNASLEENAEYYERMRESVTRWSEARTEENGRNLWAWLRWWSGSSEIERGTENSPTVGEIGWKDGNGWHPIPLVHQFPLAQPLQYNVAASRLRDGELETIVGTQIGEYTRWSIDVSPGEEIYLRMYIRSGHTKDIAAFFYGSALSLARDFEVDVRSLRQVSRAGFRIYTSLTISDEQFLTVYYFACPPTPDGSVPDSPGFWSLCPDPLCSDCRLHADAAQVGFHVKPFVEYVRINKQAVALLQDLESQGSLHVPDITYASDPPFASIAEVSEPRASTSVSAKPHKKRFGDALLSAFSKNRKTS
ncbi:hypothetical protein SISNIDRAFT_491397 [Sistotremastrum niveocremeum HHB9708]|uniref:Uncharacterized protein n=1 Tax=Sistotremastrum niveocremeum HHB9708 TaxID=1314777 RepID=A0A164MUI1_9AGAM|nr:hypothetical protein SISNIDRAFT_491397 [Sistotremastrum niveocremeum HHB9708]